MTKVLPLIKMKPAAFCFILFFTFSFLIAGAQSDGPAPPPGQSTDKVFTVVQYQPRFRGDLPTYLQKHIKYPKKARMAEKTGKVYISFIVEKDGSVTNVKVLRGVPDAPELDAEAVRVIAGMPRWEPGMQNGVPVRVQYNIPINFQLK